MTNNDRFDVSLYMKSCTTGTLTMIRNDFEEMLTHIQNPISETGRKHNLILSAS